MSRFIPQPVAPAGLIVAVCLGPVPPATATPRSALQAAGGPAAPSPWRRPVTGSVVRRFDYDRGRPFTRGARRGVDLSASAGTSVRAPCAGRVTHAGAVPGRRRGVSVRCGGGLRATLVGLGTTTVRRGARVRAGDRIGVAAGPTLRLGARETSDRFAYVDPLALLASGPRAAPPLGRAPRGVRRPRTAVPQMPARGAPEPDAQLADRSPPLAAFLGVALLAAATGSGAIVRRGRSRPGAPHAAPLRRRRTGSAERNG